MKYHLRGRKSNSENPCGGPDTGLWCDKVANFSLSQMNDTLQPCIDVGAVPNFDGWFYNVFNDETRMLDEDELHHTELLQLTQ